MTNGAASPTRTVSPRPWRALVVLVTATLLAVFIAIIAGVGAVSRQGDGKTEMLVGSWDAGKITAAAWVASVVVFFVLVCAIPAPRWLLLLFLPLRFLAFCAILPAGLLMALASESSVVPLIANGCTTGYVVRESTPWRHTTVDVLRTDGLLATKVERGYRRGGEHPFAAGDYRVDVVGDTLRVEAVPGGTPSFDLPSLVDPPQESCGLTGGSDVEAGSPPSPSAPVESVEGPAPSPAADARAELARMVQRTLDAAGGPVTDAAGAPVSAPLPSDLACDGTVVYDLAIRTDDNAASYAAILDAWSAEGYSKDRAMQEDLRYDGVVRLSARDRSSIDGLMHFSLTAECRAG